MITYSLDLGLQRPLPWFFVVADIPHLFSKLTFPAITTYLLTSNKDSCWTQSLNYRCKEFFQMIHL